jgi:succinate-semialdehyde dehydrogenase/glutarate-semialdehyde dehydrogenase
MAYISFDPWRQREVASYQNTSDKDLALIVSQSWDAFLDWRTVMPEARCRPTLLLMADILRRRSEELAVIMATEMGKPVSQGVAEAEKCALLCRWYAEHAPRLLVPEKRASSAHTSLVSYEPQGIILGIMPWNFPLWQVFRFIVPALAGGNGALLKHASCVPRSALAIEQIVAESGIPEGLFRTIFPSYIQVNSIITDRRIRGVSLTGSTAAGRQIASVAGANLKKMVIELGGSDPFIVFADAQIERAVEAAVISRFLNGGQSCIAAKRIIVHEDIYVKFRDRFVEAVSALRTGDPLDHQTYVGPMVNIEAADELERQLIESLKVGATLLCGGRARNIHPALFIPAVVENVPPDSPLADEETFGPVAPLFCFSTREEALKMANETPFGLGATVWTDDEMLALEMARDIDTGTVAINGFVKSDPALPFGGVKESGYGRELSSEGLHEFLNIKTINIFGQ